MALPPTRRRRRPREGRSAARKPGAPPGRTAFRAPRSALGRVLFITGTDTAVGKTVLATRLTRHLREVGVQVAALKPVCSGGRADARALRAALGGGLTLDEINPWHFGAALAPLAAARGEGRRLRLPQVVAHVRRFRKGFELVVVEGAGGLLSPLGEGFSSRELLTSLRAVPVVVCPNRLGAVSQALLVLDALPLAFRRRAFVVLAGHRRADPVSRSNRLLVTERLAPERVIELPWLPPRARRPSAPAHPRIRRALNGLVRRLT